MVYYLNLIKNYTKNLPSPIVKMLIESLVFSRYIYALSVWGSAISKDSLCRLNQFQDRAVCLACGSMTMCLNVGQDLSGFQLISLCDAKVFWQHYLGGGILFDLLIKFGNKHSYRTRQLPWFGNISRCKTCFGHIY